LARAQADLFLRALGSRTTFGSELVEVETHGDAISSQHPRGGFEAADGQFTAELERELVSGKLDVAVHSFKDLPTEAVPDTVVVAVLPRADARDCLMTRFGGGLADLAPGAAVGTSSVRRASQLREVRPDIACRPIRGNVDTRVARMERGEYDGVVVACAGLDRLGKTVPESSRLPFEIMLPAPAQGALAIQVRRDRANLLGRLAALDHAPTRVAVEAERALLRAIGGGCLAPLAALGQVVGARLRLRAAYGPEPGERIVRADVEGPARDAERLVAAVAARLLGGRPT
jgi:hydroxymethylbilane synthase